MSDVKLEVVISLVAHPFQCNSTTMQNKPTLEFICPFPLNNIATLKSINVMVVLATGDLKQFKRKGVL